MARFTNEQTAEISKAIARAVARLGYYTAVRNNSADIAQDAWVKVLAGFDATAGHTPGAFAYTVATRVALDYARNRGAKLRARDLDASLDAPVGTDDDSTALVDTLASATDDPATMAHASVRATAVQAALATVGDAGRDAIEAWLAGDTMTGAQRIAKKRALDALQDQISTAL